MKVKGLLLLLILLGFFALNCTAPVSDANPLIPVGKLLAPTEGVYHGAFPDYPEFADFVWEKNISDFESLVGKRLAWSYFAHDWSDGLGFPTEAVLAVARQGKIPYIRILPRSIRTQNAGADPLYNLARLLSGEYDASIRYWARKAKETGLSLLVEFAPEVNGRWYPWNGLWNGAGETTGYGDPTVADGPERYRDTYRRVVDLAKEEGANNITWVFHVDSQPQPIAPWNQMANYYPGDAYVDWIGVSVFGAQYPWDYWDEFGDVLDSAYAEIESLSPTKPIAIVEFGVVEDEINPTRKATWLENALNAIRNGKYPRVKAISYWHEQSWIPSGKNNLRLDSSPDTLSAYRKLIADPFFVSEPVIR